MSTPMIQFDVTLRPLRVGFLVRPDDVSTLRRIIQYNTTVWGGAYNPLIPAMKRLPDWWGDKYCSYNAQYVVDQYISLFEPDIIVVSARAADTAFTFRPEDTMSEEKFFERDYSRDWPPYGLSAIDIYSHLYHKMFRFTLKDPPRMILPRASRELSSLLISACFGNFPSDTDLEYIKTAYVDAFSPDDVRVGHRELQQYQERNSGTPLNIGRYQIEEEPHGRRNEPILFLCDPRCARDALDFWNLRAAGFDVRAVAQNPDPEALAGWREIIERHHRPYRSNPNIWSMTTVMPSRSLTEGDARAFIDTLGPLPQRAVALQRWYPRLWDHRHRSYDNVALPALSAGNAQEVVPLGQSGRVSFQSVAPEFAARWGGRAARWVNTVRFRDYRWESQLAQVFPAELKQANRFLRTGLGGVSVSSEGLVFHCEYKELPHHIELRDNVELFIFWLAQRNIQATLSDAGRNALQIAKALRGPYGAGTIAYPDLIRLLDKVAHGLHERVDATRDDSTTSRKPATRYRSVSQEKLWGILRRIHNNDADRTRRHLEELIEHNVLRLGLEIQCSHCGHRNWYGLQELHYTIGCERCLGQYPFPQIGPKQTNWHYRTQGPFSIENYSRGSYPN